MAVGYRTADYVSIISIAQFVCEENQIASSVVCLFVQCVEKTKDVY